MNVPRTTIAALGILLLLVGCTPTAGVDLPPEPSGPPCTAAPGDEAQLELIPGDWPEPPVGALLCEISADPDLFEEHAAYRFAGPIEDVIGHYRAQLPEDAIGEAEASTELAGQLGGTRFGIVGTPGGYLVVFGEIPACGDVRSC